MRLAKLIQEKEDTCLGHLQLPSPKPEFCIIISLLLCIERLAKVVQDGS